MSLGNLARLLKLIQKTSQSTSERCGRNLAMLANIITREFDDLPEFLATNVTLGYAPKIFLTMKLPEEIMHGIACDDRTYI